MSDLATATPINAHAWQREENAAFTHSRAIEIGTAGEFIVCADLILKGYRAYLSAQGLAYDAIVDVDGNLIRVAVKSTMKQTRRPAREGNRICYSFAVTRSRRLASGKTDARSYKSRDIDIVAFCALDIRQVAYCHISECATSMHFDPPHAAHLAMYRGKIPGRDRKTFTNHTFQRALEVHNGERAPSQLKGRA